MKGLYLFTRRHNLSTIQRHVISNKETEVYVIKNQIVK